MHSVNLSGKKVLVTGGAGFIGSNLVKKLLEENAQVVVLDNFETGKRSNIEPFFSNPNFELIEGDIRDFETCCKAVNGCDMVTHQAALGSVPRSIATPDITHSVNATGFLNMLHAAQQCNVKRFVYASSSSVYGDSEVSPKTIGSEGNLLSPYAVTKKLNEDYAKVYYRLHNLETIGLRYFNVFGPNQDPHGVYAAAIPKFIEKLSTGQEVTIHGDGNQTRDFTFVDNAVKANILALSTPNNEAFGGVYNVACGKYFSLNDVINTIKVNLERFDALHADHKVIHGPERPGDIRNSLADIQLTEAHLGYVDPVQFEDGMLSYLYSIFVRD
jgi:nucleoside-diphosphate-sugar epimerase